MTKNASAVTIAQPSPGSFDLFRLSKSKELVDVCSNTLREFQKQGLKFYRTGKAVFVSRSELEQFIRTRPQPGEKAPAVKAALDSRATKTTSRNS